MQKLTPFLWFNANAEEAMNFYTSIFANAKVLDTTRYGDAGPGPKGALMTARIELEGLELTLLNGGPMYNFTPAVSFVVDCESQAEIDHYWDRLLEGGKADQCGWLTDRFGLSWQVVPTILPKLLGDKDTAKATRAMQAMLQMGKIDIPTLQKAYDGR